MPSLFLLKELYHHMRWADAKIWDVVLSIQDAQKDEKLKSVLYHLHVVQYAFYYIWSGLPLEFPEISKFGTLQEVASWAAKYHELCQSFLTGLHEKDLERIITIPWSNRLEKLMNRKPSDTHLAETVIQVAFHSSHHRGQVNGCIRELKSEPPLVDFLAWVWFGKPDAVWSKTSNKK